MFSQRHSVLRTPPSSVPHSASSTQSLLAADSSPLPFLGTLTVPLIIIWNLLSTIPLFIGRNVWIKRTVERAFPGARSDDFDAVERLAVAQDGAIDAEDHRGVPREHPFGGKVPRGTDR